MQSRGKWKQKLNGEMDCNRFFWASVPVEIPRSVRPFKSLDCRLRSLNRPDAHTIALPPSSRRPFRPHICVPFAGNTRIHAQPSPSPLRVAQFFFSPLPLLHCPRALHLAVCIPRIIRILQLLHGTVLTNKKHVVITSARLPPSLAWPRSPSLSQSSRVSVARSIHRIAEKHGLFPPAFTMVPNSSFVGETPSLVYIQKMTQRGGLGGKDRY